MFITNVFNLANLYYSTTFFKMMNCCLKNVYCHKMLRAVNAIYISLCRALFLPRLRKHDPSRDSFRYLWPNRNYSSRCPRDKLSNLVLLPFGWPCCQMWIGCASDLEFTSILFLYADLDETAGGFSSRFNGQSLKTTKDSNGCV